jgi:Fe-Mn family superoxide dismutase
MLPYTLPDLDYDFGALEPHISGAIMELHHGKHHAAYVKNANETLMRLDEARTMEDFTRLAALERALAFNLSGHILHSIFWKNLTPKGGDAPSGDLARLITRDFGSFQSFKEKLTNAAAGQFGSGWGWLVVDGGKLDVIARPNQDSPLMEGKTPLLGIDVWEHAYYLKYQNRRPDYLASWWDVVNWDEVARRYDAAK